MLAGKLVDQFNQLDPARKIYAVQWFLGNIGTIFEGFTNGHADSGTAKWALDHFAEAIRHACLDSISKEFLDRHHFESQEGESKTQKLLTADQCLTLIHEFTEAMKGCPKSKYIIQGEMGVEDMIVEPNLDEVQKQQIAAVTELGIAATLAAKALQCHLITVFKVDDKTKAISAPIPSPSAWHPGTPCPA